MNAHAFNHYLRSILRTPQEFRASVLKNLRENGRTDLADAAEQIWTAVTPG